MIAIGDTSDWHDFDSVEEARAFLVASGYREVDGEWLGPVRVDPDGLFLRELGSIFEGDGEVTVMFSETDVYPEDLGPEDVLVREGPHKN